MNVYRRRKRPPSLKLHRQLPPVASNNQPCINSLEDITLLSPKLLEPLPSWHKLQTYELLAANFIEEMKSGNFVGRSASRWNTQDTRESDANVAISTVLASAAIAIQSTIRRYLAQRDKARNIQKLLDLQVARASWVKQQVYKYMDDQLPGMIKEYYLLAARIIQYQLFVATARKRGKYLRRPLHLERFVQYAVDHTTHLVYNQWKRISYLAAITIQCRHRVNLARYSRTFWSLLVPKVVNSTAQKIIHLAAQKIQRVQRGRYARSCFRQIALKNTMARWVASPERGYLLYKAQAYFEAALVFEQCFVNGYNGPLRYWRAFATSNFFVYEASGDPFNLNRAILGFESLKRDIDSTDGCLYIQALFYRHEFYKALDLGQRLLSSKTMDKNWRTVVLIICAMINFDQKDYSTCAMHLEEVISLLPLVGYTELELRFMLANVYLLHDHEESKISSKSKEISIPTIPIAPSTEETPVINEGLDVNDQPKPQEPAIEIVKTLTWADKSELQFIKCFAIVELEPNFGFYHGVINDTAAEGLLESTPPGTFLVHRKKKDSKYFYIKVKWNEGYTSMKILYDGENYNHLQNLSPSDSSINGFLLRSPSAAGIDLSKGLRQTSRKLFDSNKPKFGLDISSLSQWKVSNTSWLNVAHNWDLHSGYIFSSYLASMSPCYKSIQQEVSKAKSTAKRGWHLSPKRNNVQIPQDVKDRAEAYLLLAKAARGLNDNMGSMVYIQQAACLNPAHVCIQKSYVTKAVAIFEPAFKRLQKLDRLVASALESDVYSPLSRGKPEPQVLILEAIYRERFSTCATSEYYRWLLRSHVRAYALNGFDMVHLDLATKAVEKFQLAWWQQQQKPKAFAQPRVCALGPSVPKALAKKQQSVPKMIEILRLMPIQILDEMAEVVYRSMQIPKSIDQFRYLIHRLKKQSKPHHLHMQLRTYLRLAFLYKAVDRVELAIDAMDKVLSLCVLVKKPQPFLWPLHMTYELSLNEARFIRGIFHEPSTQSYLDFAPLHVSLVNQVKVKLDDERRMIATAEYRAKYLNGIVLTVGASSNLNFASVLKANVRIVVKCDGKVVESENSPNWQTMQPNWMLERIVLPTTCAYAHIRLQVLDRLHGRDNCLGMMSIPIESLLETGVLPLTTWTLRVPSTMQAKVYPTLQIGFQLTLAPPVRRSEDISISFALDKFLTQPFIWERFAMKFIKNLDYFVAREFLERALQRHTPPYAAKTIRFMLYLARCDLALPQTKASAMEWLQKAHSALIMLENPQHSLENEVIELIQQAMLPDSKLLHQLKKIAPLTHDYIRVKNNDGDYYVDKDTGECFLDQPLGFEANQPKARLQRMVLFSTPMKERILRIRSQMKQLAALDPDQWIEVFDDTHGSMFYVSSLHALQSYTKPAAYIMVANEMTVYSVLIIQDLFRHRRLRAKLRRIFRRCVRTICLVRYLLLELQKRQEARRIRAAKVPLNCIEIMIEYAEDLRVADRLSSDPFVTLQVTRNGKIKCPRVRQTSVQLATLTPIWNELFHIPYAWVEHEVDIPLVKSNEEDEEDDDEEDKILKQVNMNTVVRDLAINLVENEETISGKDEQEDERALVLTVFDFDAPKHPNDQPSRDFLGMAIVPLDPLDHGLPISAELTLRDEDGYLSPRPRGTINITIHWISYRFPLQFRTVALAVKVMTRFQLLLRATYNERAKREAAIVKPKPVLTEDLKMLLELLDQNFNYSLTKLADAIIMADQLQRLHSRWLEAQKGRASAEEEKHIELRLKAVIRDQFQLKYTALISAKAELIMCLKSFGKVTAATAGDYIASLHDVSLKERIKQWLSHLGYTGDDVITWQGTIDEESKKPDTFDNIMEFVLKEKQQFVVWENSLKGIICECFAGGSWSFDMTKELAVCRKIEDNLYEHQGIPRPATQEPQEKNKPIVLHPKRLAKTKKKH
ncbi:hypothetical protein THRCLA_02841 [Thraustotheca clavata]|uniref:C2 domain-containing protein n=1 Tax=Thraustotheca clavata TaxID=74557 RepID=A0A1W0A3V5_9STRA|nr:hypothetical protein THRCLA_02841 [Thraustotheca clavata]